MRSGTVLAGVIVFLFGLAGLAELFGEAFLPFSLAIVVSAYLNAIDTLILFVAVTVIGFGLIIGGTAARPTVVYSSGAISTEPRGNRVIHDTLSDLELAVLRYLSQRKNATEIANITGVATTAIVEKISILRVRGYINERDAPTEKGFAAVHPTKTAPATR